MPSLRDRQTSFAGGEFAPSLYGRTDVAKYGSGCRTARNFFVSPHGTLVNRPGSMYVGGIADSNYHGRMASFVFSDTDSLLLVFVEHRILVYRYVEASGRSTYLTAINADVPYDDADLADLRFCQMGDVVVITHPEYLPHELKRLSADCLTWSLETITFSLPIFPLYGGTPVLTDFYPPDEAHPPLEWSWRLTRILKAPDGRVYESAALPLTLQATQPVYNWDDLREFGREYWPPPTPSDPHPTQIMYAYITGDVVWCRGVGKYFRALRPILPEDNWGPDGYTDAWEEISTPGYEAISSMQVCYADTPINIRWDALYGPVVAATAGDDCIIATRIYRGRDGHFGFVGETTDTWFWDDGAVPDFSCPPPLGEDPFHTPNGVWGYTTEYPSVALHHQGRRFYAALTTRPWWVGGSAVEDYSNFDEATPAKDSSSVSFEIASNKFEKVRALISRDGLLVFTDNTEWLVGGSGQSEVLTPNSIARRPISKHGSGKLEPLEIGDSIAFVQRKGTVPRIMMMGGGGFKVIDASVYSRHLFTGHTIVAWAYAEDPWNLIWAVRDDGVVLTCTFLPDQEMLAWAEAEVAGGTLEDVCSVPEGTEDAVYMLVRRDENLYLERLATRVLTDVREGVFLDASITYDGRNTTATKTVAVAAGAIGDVVVVTVAGETVAGEKDGKTVRVWAPDGTSVLSDLVYVSGTSYSGTLQEPLATAIVATDEWAICKTSINDVPSFLDGQEVYALADGNVVGPLTAGPGGVTLLTPAYLVHVGLLYGCDFESLDMAQEKGKQKIVKTVTVETVGARGGQVGQSLDEDDLEEIKVRRVQDSWGEIPLQNDETPTIVKGNWALHGRVAYRQSQPLPIEIVGITREVEVGG